MAKTLVPCTVSLSTEKAAEEGNAKKIDAPHFSYLEVKGEISSLRTPLSKNKLHYHLGDERMD